MEGWEASGESKQKKRGSGSSRLLRDEQRQAGAEELGVCMWRGGERKKDGLQKGFELECLRIYVFGEERVGRGGYKNRLFREAVPSLGSGAKLLKL